MDGLLGVFYLLFSYCLAELFSINTYVSLTRILITHASLLESVWVKRRSSLSYAGRYFRRLQKYLLPYDWQHGQRCCNAARFVSVIKIIIDENNPLLLANLSACHKSQLVESARPSKSICEEEQHKTSNGIEASSEPEDSEPVPSGGHSTQNNHLNSFRNSS